MDGNMIDETVVTDTAEMPTETVHAAEDAASTDATGPTDSGIENAKTNEKGAADTVDYQKVIDDDLNELRAAFPELEGISDITALPDVMRYATLRDLGLSATEAYLASSAKGRKRDNRAHLVTAVSRSAGAPRGAMSREELHIAKELFSDMSDTQIYDLYKRVTK
ncbi:MAG: hypothetical protein IKV43_06105 [Clostridia bacterium]|nr:hypothetical protein [Clostridia bacterium]